MKRILCILLAAVLVLVLCACLEKEEEFQEPVQFYYLRVQEPDNLHHGSADSVIAPETREAHGIRDDLTALLTRYLAGPGSEDLRSPFPSGTALIGLEYEGTTLSLTVSDEFAGLTGINLTLACACLTATCLELTDALTVQIAAESAVLDGKEAVIMDQSSLVLTDNSILTTEPTEN